jgi:hypothetical protein
VTAAEAVAGWGDGSELALGGAGVGGCWGRAAFVEPVDLGLGKVGALEAADVVDEHGR